MNVYHYGLRYNKLRKSAELVTYRVFEEPDVVCTPEWLCSFLSDKMHLKGAWIEHDILVSLNSEGRVTAVYPVQNGAQTYTLFSLRVTVLYALLSFRESFVFVHYKAKSSCKPDKRDDIAYHSLSYALASVALKLKGFVLIGKDGFYSYRMQGDPPHPKGVVSAITSTTDRAA